MVVGQPHARAGSRASPQPANSGYERPSLPQFIWAHQFSGPGFISAPELTELHRKQIISTLEWSGNLALELGRAQQLDPRVRRLLLKSTYQYELVLRFSKSGRFVGQTVERRASLHRLLLKSTYQYMLALRFSKSGQYVIQTVMSPSVRRLLLKPTYQHPHWRQPRGKSRVNLPQMPLLRGGICTGVD